MDAPTLPGLQPFYQRENVTLYCAESLHWLEQLPAGCADALVTDPPYSSGGLFRSDKNLNTVTKYQGNSVKAGHLAFSGDNRDARSWAMWSTLWLTEAGRIVKQPGYALVFTDWRQLPNATDALQAGGWIWRGLIAWDKGLGARAPHTGYFRHQAEYLVWGTVGPTGRAPGLGGPFPGVYRANVDRKEKRHLAGKPTKLFDQLLDCVPRGGTVLDPFAGSASAGVSCVRAGLGYLGCEIDPANCETAAAWLDAEFDARAK